MLATMAKVRPDTLREVQVALESYEREVQNSGLLPKASETYMRYARMFVRWLDDDFIPGDRLPMARRRGRPVNRASSRATLWSMSSSR